MYDKQVPKGFKRPSMYFPVPFTLDSNDTNVTFKKTFSLSAKLFHKDTVNAETEVEKIADSIRKKRSLIPILNAEGVPTGEYIRFSRIETREVEEGVMTMAFQWDSRYFYNREEWPSFENFKVDSGVK
jgi:hypothetical protein